MSDNPASVIDEEAFTVSRTIHIAAPVHKVWSAVTEPEHISRWFGQTVLDGSGPGARGTMSFDGYPDIAIVVEELDEPRSVSYRWGEPATSTVFTFTLDPDADGTRLTVVETGFERTDAPSENLADHAIGWVSELDKLVALFETADTAVERGA
ncbi:SRPBCC domain-containing protein [Leifsonia sp. fls2-241-R2A-40a]|uniref:SRPBCC domain-containing protein n=1 Tax=Leifsonia sp. fls2-241-R2A-40a TaxID=3040290 RepID=UPI00254E944E|nr:SRPBCC domain-containing protein [Leifsonia sp. fls2-241-R2A-40a]